MRRIFGYAVLCFAIVVGSNACGGGGKSDPQTNGGNNGPYYEIYGAHTGDTTITTTGHAYLGSSNTGSVFNVSGYGRFILYVPSTSSKILFDAFGLGAYWPNSTADHEYAHYTINMNPTGTTWDQGGDTCIEGPPDGRTMENTVGADSYYGFSTYNTSTLTVYIVP
jgi:hypothetical protein